jgi:cysteine desulfurase/selenocysteine lyase
MAHPEILFFDNASTSQKPKTVLDEMANFYKDHCANAGRSAYAWSTKLTKNIENSRLLVSKLINANPDDIAFTSGATDSLNLVAWTWGLHNLKDGDEVMLCLEDHQSAVLPWFNLQTILKRFGIDIRIVQFAMHPNGAYDRKDIKEKINAHTRLVAVSHVHHLYGLEMDIEELLSFIPEHALISLDCSQSVGHTNVDVQKLGVHFVSFSGHKIFAANGTGVLWTHPEIRKDMWPGHVGAKSNVTINSEQLEVDRSTLAGIIECGTLNLPGILSYRPAVRFIELLGIENIESHVSKLTAHLKKQLGNVPGIEFGKGAGHCVCTKGYGIISFRLSNRSSSDLAAYLDSFNIFVRTGDHCIIKIGSDDDYARVSLHVYNTFEEIDRFVETVKDVAA